MATADTNAAKVSPPESPTTARPFEMDDDDVQDTAPAASAGEPNASTAVSPPAATSEKPSALAASEEAAPPQPPRPMTVQQKNEQILREAFPTVESAVIKAVLSASRGRVESAFNALLEMTDPDAAKNETREEEEVPPPQPPRPSATARSQMEADELYARQLAEHFDNVGSYEARTTNQPRRYYDEYPERASSRGMQNQNRNQFSEREYSFMEDDLPVIRENLRKGFVDTQTKVNGWISNFKKKLDETFDEPEDDHHQQHHQSNQSSSASDHPFASAYGRPGAQPTQGMPPARRSNDYHRYDADAEHLGDDFAGIKLSPDGAVAPRPSAFRSPQSSPRPDGRKVSFKEEDDVYSAAPSVPQKNGPGLARSGTKSSKWQPLSSADSNPMADNDPFGLGDSDDDKDVAKEAPAKPAVKDAKQGDTDRVKQAAAEAMSESLVEAKEGDAGSAVKKE